MTAYLEIRLIRIIRLIQKNCPKGSFCLCAWFDEKDYFEFYPLHVVKKLQERKKKRMIYLKSHGTSVEVPEEDLGRKVKIV